MAEAAFASAKAALSQAEINLQRTEVRSPVDGYVTNLLNLGGILVAPFVRHLFFALVILIAVRFVAGRLALGSMFANPPLAEAALYVCILASLIAFWI
jgi:multidrug efflux pump subunit AcrA (membrane-fusion protein)